MSYYTSYETSVALRQAGAPQEIPAGGGYWRDFGDARHHYVTSVDREAVADVLRSMRLDEILEALPSDDCPALRVYWDSGTGCVEVLNEDRPITSGTDGYGNSLVEAAAACWLAVLRAAREVAR